MSIISSNRIIKSKNGYDIHAILSRPLNQQEKGCIVLCHGTCSDSNEVNNSYVYLSHQLASNGFAVIRFDFIGDGYSQVDYIQYSYQTAIDDTQDVIDFVRSLGFTNIGIVGWSQGATIAMLSANEHIKSVVCLAGAVDMKILIDENNYAEAKQNGFSWYDPGFRKPVRISYQWFEDVLHTDVIEIYTKKYLPTLAIHGTNDTIVHPKYSKMIVDASNHPNSKVIYIENANHIFNVLTQEYQVFHVVCEEIIRWFNEILQENDL